MEVLLNLGVGLLEHRVQQWSSRLIIGGQGLELELTVDNCSSRLRIGVDGTNLEHTVHVLEFQFWIWSSWLNG